MAGWPFVSRTFFVHTLTFASFRKVKYAAAVLRRATTLNANKASCQCPRVSRPTSAYVNHKRQFCAIAGKGMDIRDVVRVLEDFAPSHLAESWDNVGLLVQPSDGLLVKRVLFTNDLTEDVLEEAIEKHVELVVSYHPPIFAALKRLTSDGPWKERLIVRCLEHRLAIYSPHTSWDATSNGVNDWLASAFDSGHTQPIQPSCAHPDKVSHTVTLRIPPEIKLSEAEHQTLGRIIEFSQNSGFRNQNIQENHFVAFDCPERSLPIMSSLFEGFPLLKYLRIVQLEKLPLWNTGMGRLSTLNSDLSLQEVVDTIKAHLGLAHVRLAIGRGKSLQGQTVRRIAICAGSGWSVLRNSHADVYWTGEMSHHEVLDAVHRGISVILCDHSNTERGFIKTVVPTLQERFHNKIDLHISEKDADPLVIV